MRVTILSYGNEREIIFFRLVRDISRVHVSFGVYYRVLIEKINNKRNGQWCTIMMRTVVSTDSYYVTEQLNPQYKAPKSFFFFFLGLGGRLACI